MYTPKPFEITKTKEMLAFIQTHSFGQLISNVEGRLFSSHIPFLVDDSGNSLVCHVAKKNPQWQSIEKQEVLVTFQGAHDYISPSWYESPGVPTWNYQAVHVYGEAKIVSDMNLLRNIVDEMTYKHEALLPEPWKPEYQEGLLQAIVGIEIEIKEIQGKYKLSQNRPENDRKRIIDELKSSGAVTLSKAMNTE